MKKIDFHVHITPPEIIKNVEKFAAKEPYFALLSASKKNKFATACQVIQELDMVGFDMAVVFGFGFKDTGLCKMVNDYVIESVKNYSSRLTGFCVFPCDKTFAEKEIDRCFSAGLKGVGELFPCGQCIEIENNKQTSWAASCIERKMPVLVHTNEPVGHYYPGKTSTTLKQLETFVINNPHLNIVFAHWGGGFLFYELMHEIHDFSKNVFYDCAASPFLYDDKIYQTAIFLVGQNKIIFGSDFPLIPLQTYLDKIQKTLIDNNVLELFLGGNAEKLLP
ncbi:MAG: hypothetical protein Ta2F_08000 [Termitinemataceae bacterium]|nr:MAG: hypothetical protein Ta2F_08000 [Termitinemataceae bacterium]